VKAFVTTLPKSGTHLLNVVLQELGLSRHAFDGNEAAAGLTSTDNETSRASMNAIIDVVDAMPQNSFVLHHVPYTKSLMAELEKRDVRPIALIRNPYDFIVSLAHHFLANPEHDTPRDLGLHAMQHWICGGGSNEPGPPTAKRYMSMMSGWINDPRTLILRFEEVIGPLGDGRFSDQLASGLLLRDFLGVQKSPSEVMRAFIVGFQPGLRLFRRGQIGSWKDEMAANTVEQVRLLYGRVFESWGYTLDGELIHRAAERDDIVEQLDIAAAGLVVYVNHLRAGIRSMMDDFGPPVSATEERAK
jgi:hypothetical protein